MKQTNQLNPKFLIITPNRFLQETFQGGLRLIGINRVKILSPASNLDDELNWFKPDVVLMNVPLDALKTQTSNIKKINTNIFILFVASEDSLSSLPLREIVYSSVDDYCRQIELLEAIQNYLRNYSSLTARLLVVIREIIKSVTNPVQNDSNIQKKFSELREKQKLVCHHLLMGKKLKETAALLNIKLPKLNYHKKIIYKKFGVKSQLELLQRVQSAKNNLINLL